MRNVKYWRSGNTCTIVFLWREEQRNTIRGGWASMKNEEGRDVQRDTHLIMWRDSGTKPQSWKSFVTVKISKWTSHEQLLHLNRFLQWSKIYWWPIHIFTFPMAKPVLVFISWMRRAWMPSSWRQRVLSICFLKAETRWRYCNVLLYTMTNVIPARNYHHLKKSIVHGIWIKCLLYSFCLL